MTTISAREAANRTRRAMALRDIMVELGWDGAKAESLDDDYWAALARTIEKRTGRPFRSPSPETRDQAIGLLKGELAIVPVAMPSTPRPPVGPAPARPVLGSQAQPGAGAIGRDGRPRVPVNVSLMVD